MFYRAGPLATSDPLPPPTQTSSMLSRIGGMLGDSKGTSNSSAGGGSVGGARGSAWRVGSGSRAHADDAWEKERRARLEHTRLVEAEGGVMGVGLGTGGAMPVGTVVPNVGSELGEMRSSNGAAAGGAGSREFGAVGGAAGSSVRVEDDQDEVRRCVESVFSWWERLIPGDPTVALSVSCLG